MGTSRTAKRATGHLRRTNYTGNVFLSELGPRGGEGFNAGGVHVRGQSVSVDIVVLHELLRSREPRSPLGPVPYFDPKFGGGGLSLNPPPVSTPLAWRHEIVNHGHGGRSVM